MVGQFRVRPKLTSPVRRRGVTLLKGRRIGTCAVAVTVISALAVLSPALASAAKPPVRYYVSLGDSLSVGYQPNTTGIGAIAPCSTNVKKYAGCETGQGYANDLYAQYRKKIPGLVLEEFGCPGDTSGSLLTGKGNDASAKLFHCNRKGGSQEAAAIAFLKAHHKKGEVPLITIDIGANDVDGCAQYTTLGAVATCVTAGEKAISTNTPKILNGLRKAAPKGTALVAMNLYDPILAYELQPYSPQYGLAGLSVGLLQGATGINADIAAADKAAGFKTADVATAFDTSDTTTQVPYQGKLVAKDVEEICTLTWMCAAPPVGPNIHANKLGYQVIAGAFESVLGKLG